MLSLEVITLFPQLLKTHFEELPFKRALEKDLIEIKLHNLRDYAIDKRGTVDDKPYGGGVGMILMIEPIYNQLKDLFISEDNSASEANNETNKTGMISGISLANKNKQKLQKEKISDNNKRNENSKGDEKDTFKKIVPNKKTKILVMSPKGKRLSQEYVRELANLQRIVILSGRYEGIDARINDIADVEFVSIGDYVLSGGELPALVIMEAVTRLLPGVLDKREAVIYESFNDKKLEYPQYTRPENFKGLKVPEILLSGHHKNIEKWKEINSVRLN